MNLANCILILLLLFCLEPLGLRYQREWQTDTTSTVNWSISSLNISAQDMPTPANGNGWWTSTETLTAPTWDILICSTTSPSLRMRAKHVSALTWWRRCFSHVDHQQTNLMMLRSHASWVFLYWIFFVGFDFFFSDIQLDFPPALSDLYILVWPCQLWHDEVYLHNRRHLDTDLLHCCIWNTERCCFLAHTGLQLSGKSAMNVKERRLRKSFKAWILTGEDNRKYVQNGAAPSVKYLYWLSCILKWNICFDLLKFVFLYVGMFTLLLLRAFVCVGWLRLVSRPLSVIHVLLF